MNITLFLIKCIIKDSYKYFNKLELYKKFYFIGFSIFFLFLPFKDNIFSNLFIMVSILVIELGFITWLFDLYNKKIKSIKLYNTIFWLINIPIVWLSNVISQRIITASLGLPATDFSLTLSLWTIFCYVPAFLIILTIIGLIIYFPTCIIWSCKMLLELIFGFFRPFIYLFIQNRSENTNNKNILNPLHFVGFVLTILFLCYSLITIFENEKKFYKLIKFTAFYTDYRVLHNYPGINHKYKVVLHPNNIYSIAIKDGSTINIIINKIE
ncbi:hypothetical protein KD918_06095 [Acinetobacter baumannii]|uniref:hypothetical protein n=2 Tax=Acinetobacter baumannii TaxID=470 RepID=UPI001BA221CE|nr:hypothetical protein [Acinetobacter baumannii]ELT4631725.1 hypothetical protein [Acinetobacter baumannii]MBR8589039.1 hypothetical protein [Acinetobacter baumannii]MCG5789396.1 hypothetical protein [Acinetobacter baumannii]MCO9045834.1 hypothetical protein [Acinetobacter baumannii]MCO9053174.1 hypothetical protein [Acinetobacter baumannii]